MQKTKTGGLTRTRAAFSLPHLCGRTFAFMRAAMQPPLMESAPGPETVIDGVKYLYFAGTSYFGLHGDPGVIEAGCDALRRFGVHTATSRAGFGNSALLLAVERKAAEFFGTEAAFYFSSGYAANHIAVQALAPDADMVLVDAEAHYCVKEAALLAKKPVLTFKHRNPADLRSKLAHGIRPLVMADGVVPSSGRMAPVDEYVRILAEFAPATLHLDDAHAVGVLGENGRGVFDHFGLWPHVNGGLPHQGVTLSMGGTLAKALGGFGGIIPGSTAFVERVRRASHYYDGASAPPHPAAGSTLRALEMCLAEPERRSRMQSNIKQLREGLRALGVEVSDESTANIGVVIRDAGTMQELHAGLKARHILVPHVPSYSGTGPQGLMRFAVCSEHTPEMIARLLQTLRELLPS